MPDIELRLNPQPPEEEKPEGTTPARAEVHKGPPGAPAQGPDVSAAGAAPRQRIDKEHPLAGYFAVGFGILGIMVSWVFIPLGFICSIIALFMGQGLWALIGVLLAVTGVLTSPVLLTMMGLAFLAQYIPF